MATGLYSDLTAAQWEQFRGVRNEFIAASVCTDPADRSAAEAAIRWMYEFHGREAPRFIWCASPAAVHLALRVLAANDGAWLLGGGGHVYTKVLRGMDGSSIVHQVEESLRRSLEESLGPEYYHALPLGQVAAMLEESLSGALYRLLEKPLRALLRGPLGDSARDSVRDSLPEVAWPATGEWVPVKGMERDAFTGHLAGQHQSKVLDYEAPRRLGLVTYSARDSEWLDCWCTLFRSCGWWWPYERVCVVAERPAIAHAENHPRAKWGPVVPHCPDGPAIAFRDGWAVHSWHGVLVPATLVEDGWDVPTILAERNVEIRRCAIEKLGWAELERHLHSVASAPDPGSPGQVLTLCDVPEAFKRIFPWPVRLLLCSNGTPEADGTRRRFALMVPARHTDPVAAAAETYGWSRKQYASLARRT
jgi:hypothetical protein